MDEILYAILRVVVTASIVIVMRYVVPILKHKLMKAVGENVYNEIVTQVRSVEQTIKGSGKGSIKKETVVDRILDWATKHGINISYDQISELIEAAVFAMNNGD